MFAGHSFQGPGMSKSTHSDEYQILLEMLRSARIQAGVTQIQLAEHMGKSQSYVSKVERGEIRLDVLQLRDICNALGISLSGFIQRFERRLK